MTTKSGSGASHRSGFHCKASSPQIALLRLQARTPTKTTVSLGTGISLIVVPSIPWIGSDSGRTVSSLALVVMSARHREYMGEVAHSRLIMVTGENLGLSCQLNLNTDLDDTHKRSVSRHTASRYGKLTSSSYGISIPSGLASFNSARILSCTSWCCARRWNVRESVLDVVSVAANTRVLRVYDLRVCHDYTGWRIRTRSVRSIPLRQASPRPWPAYSLELRTSTQYITESIATHLRC